ncbi:DUF4838 domain-containing protein [Methylocystis sp. IM3]|uniref:DUF4838 domain-containing protein n=1 Tax=Methylocystis sp. IM3 TaxID=3136722 RepID=UPI0031193C48
MPIGRIIALLFITALAITGGPTHEALGATAGLRGSQPLNIVDGGKSATAIIASPKAGRFESQAVNDLQKYIALMTGVALPIVNTPESIEKALASARPLLIVGQAAVENNASFKAKLAAVVKSDPHIRADGIGMLRDGNKIFLAGANDESHYFAVAELLRAWGVRWFMPGQFGECVPQETRLVVDNLKVFYAPPFELRSFWVSWLGESSGVTDFQLRNMMVDNNANVPPAGHALGQYTAGLGKSVFEIPLTDSNTADHVAKATEKLYAAGKDFSLSMEDGLYTATAASDAELNKLQWDKYSLRPSVSDAMLALLNGVARRLRESHPESRSKIGFLAYSNMFLPPVRTIMLEPALYGMLAPIDIDPIHSVQDPRSPPKQEYLGILKKWADITHGRLTIYDYDQSMLVWRDLPNPSHQAFEEDVKAYRDAGVLGIATESRMALATTFTNLYLRARLMWNPDADVHELLEDFYARFFGPAREPMRAYWSEIFDAWEKTIVTEHEYFVAPAIYTPELVERLGPFLQEAEKAVQKQPLSKNGELYVERLRFVRLGYETMRKYAEMVKAAASDLDFQKAVAAGQEGLRARDALTEMNKAFTASRLESGTAFWSGEVQHYQELLSWTNGEKGRLLAPLPLEWSFHRDPDRTGKDRGFLSDPVDLSYWRAHRQDYDLEKLKDYPPTEWEMIRTDLYVQAQGIRHPDQQSFTGDIWYRTQIRLSARQAVANPHILFPGLFNACELFINGAEVAKRQQVEPWWVNDYRFEWDVPLINELNAGDNTIALRCHNTHHMGGMFRRPFLYTPVNSGGG